MGVLIMMTEVNAISNKLKIQIIREADNLDTLKEKISPNVFSLRMESLYLKRIFFQNV
jgi:hypothetical protein